MDKQHYINDVTLIGEVASSLEYNHEYKGIDYYLFYMSVKRNSKKTDTIPVIITLNTLSECNISIDKGNKVKISGRYLSYSNNISRKLKLYVLAKTISSQNNSYEKNNVVMLKGYVAKSNSVCISSKGKKIFSFVIGVYRKHRRTSYIPCVTLNLKDKHISKIRIGTEIIVTGKIQSRKYMKYFNDGKKSEHITYEVFVNSFNILD